MNDVRIANYTLIAALILLLATYMTAMMNMAKINSSERELYSITALRL